MATEKVTNENFQSKINPKIIKIGIYSKRTDRINVKCSTCNHEWNPIARKLLEGQGCPECNRLSKMLDGGDFADRVRIISPNILILSPYKGKNANVHCKCLLDDYEWDTTAGSLLIGKSCPKCSNRIRRTHDEFVEDLGKINNKILVLGKFTAIKNKIKVKCKTCGYIWDGNPKSLLRKSGCPHCSGRNKTQDEFITELRQVNSNIKILTEYKRAKDKLQCECLIDGHKWEAEPSNLLQGKGCPMCKSSKGEKRIFDFLKNNDIFSVAQKQFDGLVGMNNKNLSYDFYLPLQNILIEYQGIQHEMPVDFKGEGKNKAAFNFSKQKEHDIRKKEYAFNNNIKLLEIWHKDFDSIENILRAEIL